MKTKLVVCPSCQRYVQEMHCPFCGNHLEEVHPVAPLVTGPRLAAVAVVLGGTLAMSSCVPSIVPAYEGAPMSAAMREQNSREQMDRKDAAETPERE